MDLFPPQKQLQHSIFIRKSKKLSSTDIKGMAVNASFFEDMLKGFLFSGEGGRFQQYFKFENDSIFPEPVVQVSEGIGSVHCFYLPVHAVCLGSQI